MGDKMIKWVDTKIENREKIKNSLCCIVIPIYKEYGKLEELENATIRNCISIVNGKYDIILFYSSSVNIGKYIEKYGNSISYAKCGKDYLKGRDSYSQLCEMKEFYELFSDYKYMLIHQTDAWMFRDEIEKWCKKGYDYIGAPHCFPNEEVGNGGFSLRKIDKFISVCSNTDFTKYVGVPEDMVFTRRIKSKLNIAKFDDAKLFAWQGKPEIGFKLMNGKLPFGCHDPKKHNWNFWKKYIKMESTIKEEITKKVIEKNGSYNLSSPRRIQDKMMWLNVNDSSPLKTKCTDKILLHDYCKEKLGVDLCNEILKVYDSPDDIKFYDLPKSFVLKCNHGSGYNIIVKDKDKLNKQNARDKLRKWLKENYFNRWGEYNYKDIKPKCYAEKYLESSNGLTDYKFWVFNGKPKFCQVISGRGGTSMHSNHYDMDWNYIEMNREGKFKSDKTKLDKKPDELGKMIEYCKKLSEPFKFVRIDFYYVNNKIYLGELTFVPGAGNGIKYKDKKMDTVVGDMLDLGIEKKEEKQIKKCVYTCICGKYDGLEEPKFVSNGFDYICFTDQDGITSKNWKIVKIPSNIADLGPKKANRYVKTHPDEFLKNYDLSIYVDGNVSLIGDLNSFIKAEKITTDNGFMYAGKHPTRNCIYSEAPAILRINKDIPENVNPQIEAYKQEGFPKNYGLTQNCILVRFHNDEKCIKLMKMWWNEINTRSYRDQLSLFYVIWKSGLKINILDKKIFNGSYFKWKSSHKKIIKEMPSGTSKTVNTGRTAKIRQNRTTNKIGKISFVRPI